MPPVTVRVFVTGERTGGGWRGLASWPPPDVGERRLWLAGDRRLQDNPPDSSGGERYRYDPSGAWRVAFDLWPIGHRFDAGHRIRLQVSSGAHPRYARNPGTGENPITATELRTVELEVLHGADQPSVLILPLNQ